MTLSSTVRGLIEACRRDVPNCVGVGVVDLSTGEMLGSDFADRYSDDFIDLLAAATVDLFQGRALRQVERLVRQRRGTPTRATSFRRSS